MAEVKITFHNKIDIRTQAQVFIDGTLISTDVTNPGETSILLAESGQYDIFLKNSTTGWEIARKLGSEAQILTLSQQRGRYVVS
jgi:hypothetical protein